MRFSVILAVGLLSLLCCFLSESVKAQGSQAGSEPDLRGVIVSGVSDDPEDPTNPKDQ